MDINAAGKVDAGGQICGGMAETMERPATAATFSQTGADFSSRFSEGQASDEAEAVRESRVSHTDRGKDFFQEYSFKYHGLSQHHDVEDEPPRLPVAVGILASGRRSVNVVK